MIQQRKEQTSSIRLTQLQSEANTLQKLYEGLLERHSRAQQQNTVPIPKANVIEPAIAPLRKDFKKTSKFAIILLGLGLVTGFGFAVVRELTDGSFRRLEDAEQLSHQGLLSLIPVWKHRGMARQLKPFIDTRATEEGARIIRRALDRHWACDVAPESRHAMAFRAIKLQLDQRYRDKRCKVFGVTSVQPDEGATSTAAALAISAASSGMKVLLIDGDLRNPSLSRMLAKGAEAGLLEVIEKKADLADVLWTDKPTNLKFLPVTSTLGERSDEILASQGMEQFVNNATIDFDYVIVDLPPLVPLSDVDATFNYMDGYIGVVAWGKTGQETTRMAYSRSVAFRDKLAGVVMNSVDVDRLRLYDPDIAQWFNKKLYSNYYVGSRKVL